MNKQELLGALDQKLKSGEITKAELLERLSTEKEGGHISITKVLYFFGAAVVILGIIFFVAQIWEDIGAAGRIGITLILGFLFAGAGSYFLINEPEKHLGVIFHVLGGALIPGGALVTLNELSTGVESLWPVAIVMDIIAGFYVLLAFFHKHVVATFFAIVTGTATLFLYVGAILQNSFDYSDNIWAYVAIVTGISYLLLSRGFVDTWNKFLVGPLNFFGSIFLLAGAFSQVFEHVFYEFFFFLLAFGGIAYAIYRKSKAILVVSTLFLIAHFSYITAEYFADSIGWPLSLIILGFIFIGLGYSSITINKKYIR